MELRIVGVIVYNPSDADIKNIVNLSLIFDTVILYLNSPLSSEQQQTLAAYEKIILIGDKTNKGMSVACDEICKYTRSRGNRYVMMLDQDSRISKECLDSIYFRLSEGNLNPAVRMLCPVIDYGNGVTTSGEYSYVDWCITSGSLLFLSDYGDRYCFDTNYFIDRVDADICRQIIEADFKIERVNSAVLHQRLGTEVKIMCRTYSEHSSIRHYYISRNRLYYNRKFGISNWKSVLQTCKHLGSILMYEHDKNLKIKAVIRGIMDYRIRKFGQYEGIK